MNTMPQWRVSPETEKRIVKNFKELRFTMSEHREHVFNDCLKQLTLRKPYRNGMYNCIYHTLEKVFDLETMWRNKCPYCGATFKNVRGLIVHLWRGPCYYDLLLDLKLAMIVYGVAKASMITGEKCVHVVDKVFEILFGEK